MTQSLEALSRRTASLTGIRGIVHTMKTLSVINSASYQHAAEAIKAYHATVLDVLHAFVSQIGLLEAPTPKAAVRVLIVFGSDHGLCGNYNEALACHVAGHLGCGKPTVLCIGAQMADALRDQGIVPEKQFFPPTSVDGIGRLANLLTRHLDMTWESLGSGNITVSRAYFTRDATNGQRPEVLTLPPLDPAMIRDMQQKRWAWRSLPAFSMAPADLFQALIRNHLFASLLRAAAEALVTENAARLALMQQAEQSVDDRLEALIAETRSVRQSEITTELLDVIIGFEALRKTRKHPVSRADAADPTETDSPTTWLLCPFSGLRLPWDVGLDDRVCGCDKPACDCDDDLLVWLSALFETFCNRLQNGIVTGGGERSLVQNMPMRPSSAGDCSASSHSPLSCCTGARPVMVAASFAVIRPNSGISAIQCPAVHVCMHEREHSRRNRTDARYGPQKPRLYGRRFLLRDDAFDPAFEFTNLCIQHDFQAIVHALDIGTNALLSARRDLRQKPLAHIDRLRPPLLSKP